LEAIGIVLETYFGFGYCNESPVGDSLITKRGERKELSSSS
jgi:hypothetical protein